MKLPPLPPLPGHLPGDRFLAATSFKCAAIVGIDRPNASEEIDSFPRRLAFFGAFVLFFARFVLVVLRFFVYLQAERMGITIARPEIISANQL